jgi:hypothetical protein
MKTNKQVGIIFSEHLPSLFCNASLLTKKKKGMFVLLLFLFSEEYLCGATMTMTAAVGYVVIVVVPGGCGWALTREG